MVRARLADQGIDPGRATAVQWLDATMAALVDMRPDGQSGLAWAGHLEDVLSRPPWPDRATFGTGTTAEAGQRAMMALTGGPAPMRDPSKKRPAPGPAGKAAE